MTNPQRCTLSSLQCGLYCFYHYSYSFFLGVKSIKCGAVGGAGEAKREGQMYRRQTRHFIFSLLCCAQSYLALCDPADGSLPGSSVHGILQARTLERVAISFSRGSNPSLLCLLHWQADSLPLHHLKSPFILFTYFYFGCTAWLVGS